MLSTDRLMHALMRWPPTWLAALAVAGLEIGFWHWFQPGVVMAAGSVALALALLALWPVLAVRSKTFLGEAYGQEAVDRAEARFGLERLRADLERHGATQGLEQLRIARQKLDSLVEVLEHRLDAGEVTYGRYLGSAEQVYLATLDNLREILVALTSMSAIDQDYVSARITELGATARGDEHGRELASLEERQALLARQQATVSSLYAQNEAALTALDNTAAALAETRTGRGHATMDAEAAMAALEDLARRADKYASTS